MQRGSKKSGFNTGLHIMTKDELIQKIINKERPKLNLNPGYGGIEMWPRELKVQLSKQESLKFNKFVEHIKKYDPAYYPTSSKDDFSYNQIAAQVFMFGLIQALTYMKETNEIGKDSEGLESLFTALDL